MKLVKRTFQLFILKENNFTWLKETLRIYCIMANILQSNNTSKQKIEQQSVKRPVAARLKSVKKIV